MLRSRIGLCLVLACLVFSLTACGGGDDESMTPPMPDNGGDEEAMTPPTPPIDSTPTTQTCLDGSTVSANQTCPTPTEEDVDLALNAALPVQADHAAKATPKFGSVTQGSNVQHGMTTDSVSMSYIPHGDTFHPVATIRTGDGTVLKSNADPTRIDVELPSGRIVHVDPTSDEWWADVAERYYTPEDWRIAEEEEFKWLVDAYGEAEGRAIFIEQYGSYPIGDDVPYSDGSRPTTHGSFESEVYELTDGYGTPSEYLRHPKSNRTIAEVWAIDVLDDSIKGPKHFTNMVTHGYTDYPSAAAAGDKDYVSWGYWAHYTITPSAVDLSFGAFADGVGISNVPATGTASYSGYTFGMAAKGGTTQGDLDEDEFLFSFLGQVSLQADFGNSSVSGRVDNFQNEYEEVDSVEPEQPPVEVASTHDDFLQNLTINLGTASIVSGTFTGDARATSGLAGAVGKWGGQFFGTPDNAGDAPSAAGGTWGVTQGTGDNDWKMLGGFGTWKP